MECFSDYLELCDVRGSKFGKTMWSKIIMELEESACPMKAHHIHMCSVAVCM